MPMPPAGLATPSLPKPAALAAATATTAALAAATAAAAAAAAAVAIESEGWSTRGFSTPWVRGDCGMGDEMRLSKLAQLD